MLQKKLHDRMKQPNQHWKQTLLASAYEAHFKNRDSHLFLSVVEIFDSISTDYAFITLRLIYFQYLYDTHSGIFQLITFYVILSLVKRKKGYLFPLKLYQKSFNCSFSQRTEQEVCVSVTCTFPSCIP